MKVLDGVTVIDFTQTYSGPFCTMQLADFGARVIRIEVKGIDDAARIWPPFSENGESGYYATNNRGKESIALDLKTPEGMEVIKKLIQNADIVVENFKVGKMAQLGLSYADVKKINPEIIYASLTGYGQNGPWNDQPAYDNVIQARSGMMEMTGFPDDVPTKVGPSISDYFGGLNLTLGVVMAYFHKQNTGEGQYIDVAMYDSLFAIMESPILCKDLLNQEATRCGNTDPTLCPYDVYPCKDGYFSVGLAAGSDAEWNRFCIAIDMPQLLEDERFATNELRIENYAIITPILTEYFRTKTKAELTDAFNANKIPSSPVNTIPEMMAHPQLKARNMLVEVEDQGVGKYTAIGNPMMLSETPAEIKKGAPLLGQQTVQICEEFGLTLKE